MYVSYNIDARSRKHRSFKKAISVTYFKCVCVCVCVCRAFLIQHAKRMRRITLSSMASQSQKYFSTLPHKRHDFRKKVIEYKTCDVI
jgi:hypothetical protein